MIHYYLIYPVKIIKMESSIIIAAKCADSDTRLWNSLIDIRSEPKKIIKYSMGTFIKIKNTLYVLSCYHGIQNYNEIYLYELKKINDTSYTINKIETSVACYSDELDLALLSLNDSHNFNTADIDDFSLRFLKKNDVIEIVYDETKKISESKLIKNKSKIELIYKETIYEKYSSFNMPELPYLKFSIKNISEDLIRNLKGLSGIICYNKQNKIIGMLSNYSKVDNHVKIIPSVVIKNFILEYSKKQRYDGISGLIFKNSFCEFEHENNDYNGIIVEKTFGIKYKDTFKNGDIIFKINDKVISKDGKIYDEEIGESIPFNSFISLNTNVDDEVNLVLMRNNPKLNDYEEIKVPVKAISYNQARKIDLNHNDKFVECNGLIFTEISENIIEFYRNHNIHLIGKLLKHFANDSYGPNEHHKKIVLINILNNKFSKENMKEINKFGLPLIKKRNSKNEYYMCILDTVNGKKVTNLSNLTNRLSNNKNILKFLIDKNIDLSINISNTNLSIKYIVK